MNKKCFKCCFEKPLSEFYRHSQMGDGHLGKCKDCTKLDTFNHRKNNPEKVRAYDRSRGRDRYILGSAAYLRYYRERFPLRRIAQLALTRLRRRGELIKMPCMKCGDTKSVAHHEDYRRPLEFVWLCNGHHRERHAEINRLGISLHG